MTPGRPGPDIPIRPAEPRIYPARFEIPQTPRAPSSHARPRPRATAPIRRSAYGKKSPFDPKIFTDLIRSLSLQRNRPWAKAGRRTRAAHARRKEARKRNRPNPSNARTAGIDRRRVCGHPVSGPNNDRDHWPAAPAPPACAGSPGDQGRASPRAGPPEDHDQVRPRPGEDNFGPPEKEIFPSGRIRPSGRENVCAE
jgi:hypothetical protein